MTLRAITDTFQGVSGAPPTGARIDIELAGAPLKSVSVLDVPSITLTVGSGIHATTGVWSVSVVDSDTHGQLVRVRESANGSPVRSREFEIPAGATTIDLSTHPESAPLKPYTERLTVESHINDTTSPHFGHTPANSTTPGFMSAADKAKLDGIEEGATKITSASELGAAPAAHVGAGGTAHAAATTTEAGFMSAADKVKLNGIQAGATAVTQASDIGAAEAVHDHNYLSTGGGSVSGPITYADAPADPAELVNKAYVDGAVLEGVAGVASFNSRTGQVSLTSADVTTALGYTPPSSAGVTTFNTRSGAVTLGSTDVTTALGFTPATSTHGHAIGDVTGLQDALDGKAATHTHPYAALGHDHDATYSALGHDHNDTTYTETEVDALLLAKSDTHTHPYLADSLYETGSFTAQMNGWSGGPYTITVHYARMGNICHLSYTASTIGTADTSNANFIQSLTAVVPAALRPTFKGIGVAAVTDSGTLFLGQVQVDSAGFIKMGKTVSGLHGFTASGVKGLHWFNVTYHLNT